MIYDYAAFTSITLPPYLFLGLSIKRRCERLFQERLEFGVLAMYMIEDKSKQEPSNDIPSDIQIDKFLHSRQRKRANKY